MLFREKKAENRLLLNHKAWMQYLFSLLFCILGKRKLFHSLLNCARYLFTSVDEKVVFQKPVLTKSIFLEFQMLEEYALFWKIKQIFWFLLSYLSLIFNLLLEFLEPIKCL